VKKPNKKNDKELFALIEQKITAGQYIFVPHAKQRLNERQIIELDVINILLGKSGYKRKRNKAKDRYDADDISNPAEDWKYCIEGKDIDDKNIRIIITFDGDLMPIITVIRL
jgi:hypothetical protein